MSLPNTYNPPARLDLCLPVATTARTIAQLITNFSSAIAASIGTQVKWVSLYAAKANLTTVLTGGSNLSSAASPTRQCGRELNAGEGFAEPSFEFGLVSLDSIYVVTDSGTPYICISIVV